ncbi:unnamed protein product [Owenia fusiformis]|uniref:Uncharacterized protein n=1 Tax=Owenia fusiformis TaxID=6347 RepID=A0A8J1TIC6_OWEFU|nr:unnamed protein product [Owenia fusiformis]
MAGIEISEEITDDQLHAMAGGEMLRQEGGNFAQVRNTKKSSVKLKESLLEHDLALPLCILMAQQRDGIIFTDQDDETHLKLVGKLYDQCQDTLVQLGSFLSTHISTDEFAQRLPKIETLCDMYHMPADAAFSILRPGYAHSIQTKFDELRKIDKSNKLTSTAQKTKRYLEAVEEVIEPLQKQVIPLHGPKIWDELSPQFYVTFWTLSMYDLQSPSEVYEKQIQALKTQQTAIEDNHSLSSSKQKKERDRCIALREKLEDEEKKQVEHINRAMARLDEEKDTWFALKTSTKNEMVTQLLQLCIFPRCVFTAIDAHYCAKFIHVLHTLKTNNFSTLLCYDRIFCDITYTVSVCTENEAHRYGRFLNACLDSIMRWHSSKEHYDKECANFPGFITVFRTAKKNSNQPDTLDYENYRHVVHKWQYTMTKAMVCCLESQNYVQIRNALIVLTRILNHYPKVQQFGQALERRVDRIKTEEKEKRPDIYALAMGYTGQLKSKKSSWVAENQFHHKEKPVGKPNGTAASGGTASKSSGASKDASKESKESENNPTGSKDDDRPEKEKKSSSKSDSKTENSKVKASNSTSSEKVKASSSTSNEKVKASSSTSDRKDNSSARSSKERDLTSERKSSSKDREKSREKGQGDDKPHKEKSSHKDRKEEKVASDDKEKRRSHKHKEEKEERKERSRSKERDRGDHAVASSGSSHRRSAEPSPKHSELERESKRRKMEAPSVKDSPHNDVKDSHKSSSRQGSEERESQSKKDRKRVSYPDDRSAEKEDKDAKRRRSEDPSGKRQMNGESSRSSKSKGEAQSSPSTTERKVKTPKEDKEKDRERKRHSKESKRRE